MPRRVMYRVVESTSEEEGFKSSSLIQTGPQVIKEVYSKLRMISIAETILERQK